MKVGQQAALFGPETSYSRPPQEHASPRGKVSSPLSEWSRCSREGWGGPLGRAALQALLEELKDQLKFWLATWHRGWGISRQGQHLYTGVR